MAKESKSFDLFIILSFSVLFLAIAASLGLFFLTFNDGLSAANEDWGAFGSYVSGTVGVTAASLAVIWLIRSVHIQKVELKYLKTELSRSSSEQEKQTHIAALTAMVSTSLQMIEGYENSLHLVDEGTKHRHPFASEGDLHILIMEEEKKIDFYQKQIQAYVKEKYEDQVVEDKDEDYE